MNGYDDQVRQNSYIKKECEKTNCDSNVTYICAVYRSNPFINQTNPIG